MQLAPSYFFYIFNILLSLCSLPPVIYYTYYICIVFLYFPKSYTGKFHRNSKTPKYLILEESPKRGPKWIWQLRLEWYNVGGDFFDFSLHHENRNRGQNDYNDEMSAKQIFNIVYSDMEIGYEIVWISHSGNIWFHSQWVGYGFIFIFWRIIGFTFNLIFHYLHGIKLCNVCVCYSVSIPLRILAGYILRLQCLIA